MACTLFPRVSDWMLFDWMLGQGSNVMPHTCAPKYVTVKLKEGAPRLGLVSEHALATLFVMAAAGLRPTLSGRLGWRQ